MKSRALLLLEKVRMLEASINRVKHHAYGDSQFAILTADKGSWFYFPNDDNISIFGDEVPPKRQAEYTRMINNRRKKGLISDLRKLGYGYFPVAGHYVEAGSDGKSDVPEKSFFILKNKDTDSKQFRKDMMELGNKYDQECIVWKQGDNSFIWLYTMDFEREDPETKEKIERHIGDTELLGNELVDDLKKDIDGVMRDAFSKLKNNPNGNDAFVFGNREEIDRRREERNTEFRNRNQRNIRKLVNEKLRRLRKIK